MADYRRLERAALSESFCTIRLTHVGCDAMAEYHRLRPRFEVLPAPAPIPPEPANEREPGPLRLLAVGRLVETKNLSLLLRVLPRFAERDWTLDIVGDGELRRRLEDEAKASGIGTRITFHGHREDVDCFYRRADLLLFPSQLESTGLVLLEAMSCGVPALAIRSDGVTYRNANHEVIARTPASWPATRTISRRCFVNYSRTRRRCAAGRAARAAVLANHCWEHYVERMESLLQIASGLPRENVKSSSG